MKRRPHPNPLPQAGEGACKRGFTLIEVMVALAILAMSLGVLLQANVQTIASVDRIDGMTQATLLARSKLLDIERKLYKDGFTTNTELSDGKFEEEGHPEIQWKVMISPVKVQTEKLMDLASQFAGMGGSGGGSGGGGSGGSSAPPKGGKSSGGGGSDTIDTSNPMAMLQPMLDPIATGISQNLRLVKLDVSWPEGVKRRGSFSVVDMVTSKALQQSAQQATGQQAGAPVVPQPGQPGSTGGAVGVPGAPPAGVTPVSK